MAYYTKYYLSDVVLVDKDYNPHSIMNNKDILEEVKVSLIRSYWGNDEPIDTCGLSEFIYDELDYFERDDFIKLMLEVSTMYPNLYFDIEGKGEDWDDHFVARFHNGSYGLEYAHLPDHYELNLDYNKDNMSY